MLRQAGAIADGVLLEFLHKRTLADYVGSVVAGPAGRSTMPKLCYSTTIVTNPACMDEIRPHMTYRLVGSPPKVKELLGITERDTAVISAAMRGGLDAAAELIPDEWIDPFVIRGNVDDCADELSTLMATHGFDEFMLVAADMAEAATLMTEVAEVTTAAG